MVHPKRSHIRIWLIPPSVLSGAAGLLLAGTLAMDGWLGGAGARPYWTLLWHPTPTAAANTLSNAGEVVAAVLAIALTVVAIIVELASNRYTHRVTELFVAEPTNFIVMGLFVVTAVQSLWVVMTIDAAVSGGPHDLKQQAVADAKRRARERIPPGDVPFVQLERQADVCNAIQPIIVDCKFR